MLERNLKQTIDYSWNLLTFKITFFLNEANKRLFLLNWFNASFNFRNTTFRNYKTHLFLGRIFFIFWILTKWFLRSSDQWHGCNCCARLATITDEEKMMRSILICFAPSAYFIPEYFCEQFCVIFGEFGIIVTWSMSSSIYHGYLYPYSAEAPRCRKFRNINVSVHCQERPEIQKYR